MIFIAGGVRSGKSAFAEEIAKKRGAGRTFYYIATGAAFDEEMAARIKRHQLDRQRQAIEWQTVEMQVDVPKEMEELSGNALVLFECVTTWLSNVVYESESAEYRSEYIHSAIRKLQQQWTEWHRQGAEVIIVSNEVLDELPSKHDEVNMYRRHLGRLHQWIAGRCDEAYEVQFQLVQRWK